jgi:hypothetical protein
MKIYMITSPTISVAAWLRRYATALIVVALVALATLGVGIAQALYITAAPRTSVAEPGQTMNMTLDQHEQHTTGR